MTQAVILDEHGIVCFQANRIVEYLLYHGGIDMNHLATKDFTDEDRQQFAQLIGYSIAGYHELSYVSDQAAVAATEAARRAGFTEAGGCRDDGCPIHTQGEE